MADLSKITCIEDLRVIAKRRVPRRCYDHADSGSYTQGTYRANEEAFQQIKLRQRVAVDMQGHADDTGPAAHNQPLSERRAQRVADQMVRGGMQPLQVSPRGWGHRKPLPREQGQDARRETRRVSIISGAGTGVCCRAV